MEGAEVASADMSAEVTEPVEAVESTEVEAEGVEPVDGEQPDAAEVPEPETYTIKVNGEERALSLDELTKMAQKGAGADAKFRAAAEKQRQLEQVVERLQGDPLLNAYLTGGEDALFDALEAKIKYQELSPEDRAKADEEKELRRKAKRAEELEKAEQERTHAARVAEYEAAFTRDIIGALGAHGLSENPAAIRRMASYVEAAMESQAQTTLEAIAQRVNEDLTGDRDGYARQHLTSLEAEALVEYLGDDVMKKIRAHEAARLKGPGAKIQRNTAKTSAAPKAAKKMTASEYLRSLREG